MGIDRIFCDLRAMAAGFKKIPVNPSLTSGSSDTCLVSIFSRQGNTACRGVCGVCSCEVSKGQFTEESGQSTTPNSIDDTHHL
jgi:ribulose kinase